MNIYVFGDSVAFGKYDSKGGWVARLVEFLETKYLANETDEFFVYNLSISGNHSADILARFDDEIKLRLSEKRNSMVIFATGLNDSAFVRSQNRHWVDLQKFQENLRRLISRARQYAGRIIFIGLAPTDEKIVDPMPWDTDKSYRNEYVKKYDCALAEAARDGDVDYISLYGKFIAADHKKLLHDGAHPSAAGHQLIFETVRDYLLEQKII